MLACSHFTKCKLSTEDAFPLADISGSIDDFIREALVQAQKGFQAKIDQVGAVEFGLVGQRANSYVSF